MLILNKSHKNNTYIVAHCIVDNEKVVRGKVCLHIQRLKEEATNLLKQNWNLTRTLVEETRGDEPLVECMICMSLVEDSPSVNRFYRPAKMKFETPAAFDKMNLFLET